MVSRESINLLIPSPLTSLSSFVHSSFIQAFYWRRAPLCLGKFPSGVPGASPMGVVESPAVGEAPDLHVIRDSVPHNNLFWGDCSHCTLFSYDITNNPETFPFALGEIDQDRQQACLIESSQHPHELHYQSLLTLELRKWDPKECDSGPEPHIPLPRSFNYSSVSLGTDSGHVLEELLFLPLSMFPTMVCSLFRRDGL